MRLQKMKRRKENSFRNKFNLLHSQNHNDDIRWSSSESSDFENVNNNYLVSSTLKKQRKRKRKKIVHNKLSNLSFSLVEGAKEDGEVQKSPIISSLYLETKQYGEKSSPILSSKVNVVQAKREVTSPVLFFKQRSSVLSPTIKKKLFVSNDQFELNKTKSINIITNEELKQPSYCKKEAEKVTNESISHNNNYATSLNTNKIHHTTEKGLKACEDKINLLKFNSTKELSRNNNFEDTIHVSKRKTKIDLIKRVQSYFDSQFGSDSASQQSISETDTLTQKSDDKSSDDLEITNSLTQNKDNSPLPVNKSNSTVSYGSWEVNLNVEKSKKNKYKKDGLAFRLDHLLKKQNANISLWQHEKFLAQNSKFIIPKSEHIVFRIQKINFKYGCYLLETVDLSDKRHLIFINGYYVNSACNIVPDAVLKLYMPYKIIDLSNNYKIVINVCKFECVSIVS